MRLHGRFGNSFLDKYRTGQIDANGNDVGIENAKRVWSEELAGTSQERIIKALQTSYDYPPSCDEFKRACRSMPAYHSDALALPKPEIDPERLQGHIVQMRDTVNNLVANPPSRAWAKRIMQRKEAGEKLPSISIAFASEVLGHAPG